MNNQSNLKRSYIEMADAADHISSSPINHFHSSSSSGMVEPQTAMANDACIQLQSQPQLQQPHIALPLLVEDLLNQLCNERKQPQPDYDVRRRLGLLGEEKALQLLHEIAEAKVIKNLSGFIMWTIRNKPQYQCPSPSPSPSNYAPASLLQTQLSASPFTPSVHKEQPGGDHGWLRLPYSYSSASPSRALRVSPYKGRSYVPRSTITPVRLFKDPLPLPQPSPQVELDRADLSLAEQEQVNQVLSLPSTKKVADKLLASEGLINSATMKPSRNDPNMQAKLMKMAKKGPTVVAETLQVARVGASPHMSVARSQGTSVAVRPARGAPKRRAEEQISKDSGKRRAEEEPMRDTGKRPMGSATSEGPRRASVDLMSGPLEPWMDGEAALGAYQEAVRRMLKVDMVEGLFTEGMGYSGMTMSALEDQLKATMKLFIATQNVAAHCKFDQGKRDEQAVTVAELKRMIGEKAKVDEELELAWGRLEEEMKKNAELLSSVNKLTADKRGLGAKLSRTQEGMDEANQKIEAFASELRSCYDDAVKDYIGSAEYQEKLAAQRVEGYFDLIDKVGEKYPSLDWSFLVVTDPGAEAVIQEELAIHGGGGISPTSAQPSSDLILPSEAPSHEVVIPIYDRARDV